VIERITKEIFAFMLGIIAVFLISASTTIIISNYDQFTWWHIFLLYFAYSIIGWFNSDSAFYVGVAFFLSGLLGLIFWKPLVLALALLFATLSFIISYMLE